MTEARVALEELAGRRPVEIDRDIFELSPTVGAAHYDRIAGLYDAALGTTVYNRALSHVAQPTGSTIGVSSIFKSGGRSNIALAVLHAARELGPPRTLATVEQLVRSEIAGSLSTDRPGSVALMTVSR